VDQGVAAGAPPAEENMEWSSYFGTPLGNDVLVDVKTDNNNDVVMVGSTNTGFFPINTNSAQESWSDGFDAIVFKLNDILEPQWGTYYGGSVGFAGDSPNETATALDINSEGFSYIAGWTESQDFPVDYGVGGVQNIGQGFDYKLVKLDANLNVVWTAEYNGPANGDDIAQAVKVDGNGNVYVTGYTTKV